MSADLDLAAGLVRGAGRLAAKMLGEGLSTKYKTSVSDVVSAADTAAEAQVVRRLTAERPADGIVGEEGTDRPGERTWYVDPVDGTYNFLSGSSYWCSAVGLTDADGSLLGAVYHPAEDELWLGGREHPTSRNSVPVAPLSDTPLARLSVASYLHPGSMDDETIREPWLRVVREAATVRMFGSGSLELSHVAGGRIGVWVQANTLPWDWYPGVALVLAAGGATAVVERAGQRWHVAGNQIAVAEVEALLV